MTLADVIKRIEGYALAQPAIKQVVRNDVFRLNSIPDAKYGVFAFVQGQHEIGITNSINTYVFTLFYVDRLTEDQSNEIGVQSVGISTLQNILRLIYEDGDLSITGRGTVNTFNQRFNDLCAGAFVQIRIQAPADGSCAQSFE